MSSSQRELGPCSTTAHRHLPSLGCFCGYLKLTIRRLIQRNMQHAGAVPAVTAAAAAALALLQLGPAARHLPLPTNQVSVLLRMPVYAELSCALMSTIAMPRFPRGYTLSPAAWHLSKLRIQRACISTSDTYLCWQSLNAASCEVLTQLPAWT